MATIKTSIQIFDGMSPAFRSMNSAMNIVLNSFEALQSASSNSIDTHSIQAARAELNKAEIAFNGVEKEIKKAEEQQQKFNKQIHNGQQAADGLVRAIRNVFITLGGVALGKSLLEGSDNYAGTIARLKLINDGQQTVQELNDRIFQSAARARGVYSQMADVIGKLGITASHAFGSNNEMIAFTELMTKQFKIAGASAQEQSSAMYQLTQAMASGRLQGDEFRSIIENAPMLAKSIAKEMDVSIGKLKELSSEGLITSDVIKSALFNSADEINKQFEEIPVKFSDVVNQMRNSLEQKLQPAFQEMSTWLNSDDGIKAIDSITNALAQMAIAIGNIAAFTLAVGTFFQDNWGWIAPIVWGIVGAVIAYNSAMFIFNTITSIAAVIEKTMAAATMLQTGATFAATAAQYGFNAALFACPITWIVLAVLALVVLFYTAIGALNKFAGTSISATGIIVGAFTSSFAVVYNIIASMWNYWASFAEFFANVFNDPVYSIKRLFVNLANSVLDLVKSIAKAIDAVFGSSLSDGVQSLQNRMDNWLGEMPESYKVIQRMEMKSIEGSFKVGYDWGKGVESKFKMPNIKDLGMEDSSWFNDALNNIAADTGKIRDSVDMSSEDLKYLRDLAEQEVVNRFTTAEISVEMKNEFGSVNSELDLDGVVAYLEEKVYEIMTIAAEGVHEDV